MSKFCTECGIPRQGNTKFCPECGTQAGTSHTAQRHKQIFERKLMTQHRFIAEINDWLEENRQLGNITCKFLCTHGVITPFKLDKVVFEYEIMRRENEYKYKITSVESGGRGDRNYLLYEWQEANHQLQIVSLGGGTAATTLSGVITNHHIIYILYKKRV